MKKQILNGEWSMTRVKTGESYLVSVPSDNYTQLLAAGAIPDPYYGTNEKDVQWVGAEQWAYERTFSLTEDEVNAKHVLLACDALDTLCEVFVNGKSAGRGENAFIRYEFDVKAFVTAGENTVKIVFDSPVEYALRLQKEKPLPKNNNGTDGIAYLRKPACHFGWDWGPSIPLSGITDDIALLCFNERLEEVAVRQKHADGKVTLFIEPIVNGEATAAGKVICPDGTEIAFEGKSELVIENPELWWTRELSGKDKQPLYTVTAAVGDSVITKKIGLRTIRLDRDADEFGGNFCFYLNETPIFAKGANWILPDALMGRCTNEVIDYYLDSAVEANFNMIRVWGGAYYSSDYFLSQCDEKGLLVWQDFCFACLMYPFYEDDFQKNVLREIEYNVKRIGTHPCVALWGGNNEIETMFSYMPASSKLVQWYKKFFYEILQDFVKAMDTDIPYIPTSPIGKEFRKGVTGDKWGDTHMWNVWHGQKPLNYYRQRPTRFCSEFGLESLPSADAVRTFAEEKDMGLTTEVFNSHQKCPNGNRKMLFYLLEKFYEPKKFEDMIYCTGLIQKECIADATEFWRRNRGRCNGSLFWQYNDCWQCPSWASVDYSGKWKPLQYHARHFFEPISVSVEEKKRGFKLYGINDTRAAVDVTVVYTLADLDGKPIYEKKLTKTLSPLKSEMLTADSVPASQELNNVYLNVKLFAGEKLLSERTKIFVPDRDLRLQKAEIQKTVSFADGVLTVKLLSPVFCRSVMVDIKDFPTPFSDNYFDLLPNEEKVITVKADKAHEVSVKSLADVEVIRSAWKAKLYRLKFALEPLNIGNFVWYSIN